MNSDKIPSPRIPLAVEVEFKRSYSRQGSKGTLRNISLTGAFLENVEKTLEPGDKLQVVFTVAGRVRKLKADVVWRNTLGAGIRFAPTNNRDTQIIDDLMYFVENKRSSSKGVFDSILKKVG